MSLPDHVLDTFISSALTEMRGHKPMLILPEDRVRHLKEIMEWICGHTRPASPSTGAEVGEKEECIDWRAMYAALHSQVSGYLSGKDWEHWQQFNAGKFPAPRVREVSESDVTAIRHAVYDCGHVIEHGSIILHQDPRKPGNALSQLHNRMRHALESALSGCGGASDGEWVKTKERPPADCTDVDAVWWGGDRKMAHLRDGVWWYYGQMGIKKANVAPEHWRPLPPAPIAEARVGDNQEGKL